MGVFESKGRSIAAIWLFVLVVFYVIAGYLASSQLYADKIESLQRHEERLDPNKTEQGRTQVDFSELNGSDSNDYEKVYVGIYADRILDISTKATSWTVDFYVWFRWRDDKLDPGETFQIINGEIQSKSKIEETVENGLHYTLYRVTARMSKFFNVVRYPHDNHLLTIRIEDADHHWDRLRYLTDENGAEYSSRVEVPGYRLQHAEIISKPHAYKTSRGDPRLPVDYKATYSQVIYGIKIDRPDWGLYFKLFQGLFASVAIALLAFVFSPLSSERISLGVGAFFASVASSYVNLSELPGIGMVTLIDMANGLAMVTIFLSIFGSIISSRIAKGEGQLETAERFDRVMLALFVVGFASVNAVMALSAAI